MGDTAPGILGWLERIFYGGMEMAFLSTPAFAVVFALQSIDPDAISLSGLFAIAAGSAAIAIFRAGVIDVGDWPRRGELSTIPVRAGYFSLVFFVSTMGVATIVIALESWWYAPLGGAVQIAGLALFPTVYRSVHGEPVRKPTQRV